MPEDAEFNRSVGRGLVRMGTSRATTTSSGVFKIPTNFVYDVYGGIAWDDRNMFRRADLTFGTTSTFYEFVPLATDKSVNRLVARFRVFRNRASTDLNSTFTLASSVSGIAARYILFGN